MLLVHAEALEERAHLRLAQDRRDAAIEDLRAADHQYAALGLEFNRIDTNTALSQALLARRDVQGATAAADAGDSDRQPHPREVGESGMARAFSLRTIRTLRGTDRRGSRQRRTPERTWRTFRTAEEVRARSLGDELALARPARSAPIDPRGRGAARPAHLAAAVARSANPAPGRRRRREQSQLRHSIEETRAQIDAIRVRHGGVAARQTSLPESLAQVQQQLPPDTAVLAYFVGDIGAHAWLLTRSELRHATLPGRDRLQRAIGAAVAASAADARPSAALGSMLLGHLLDGIRETRMLVLADGPLNGVPFASLPVPGAGGELLIDRFVLGYAPSLALAMDKAAVGEDAQHAWSPWSPTRCTPPTIAGSSVGRNGGPGRCAAPRRHRQTISRGCPIRRSRRSAVIKAFGSDDTIQLSGFDATAERVLQLPSSELAVLHFATHADARRDSPEQSALYLSEYTPDGALLPIQPPDRERHRAQRTARRRRGAVGLRDRRRQRICAAKVCSVSPTDFSPTARTRSWRRCGPSKTPPRRAS